MPELPHQRNRSVALYCNACNELHRYTPGEVERIVYTLDARQADAVTDNELRVDGDAYEALACLDVELGASGDCEVYLEHVDACVERRRALTREEALHA